MQDRYIQYNAQEVYIGTNTLHVSITIASLVFLIVDVFISLLYLNVVAQFLIEKELIPLYGRYEFNVISLRDFSSSRFTWFYRS